MPVKKTKATSSASSRASAVSKKPRFLPPRPLQVETQTAVATTPTVALGVGMICATLIGVAFIASIFNAAAGLINPSPIESNERANNFDLQYIPNYEAYKQQYLDAGRAKFFNVYVKSKVTLGRNFFTDQCLQDNCDSSGNNCKTVITAACDYRDKNCRLKEGFVITTPLKMGTWEYNCPLGCSDGACRRPPVCTDSDLNSATGQSDPFMKGFTKGIGVDGKVVSLTDFCTQSNVWPATSSAPTGPSVAEWYCDKGIVSQVLVGCDSGCIDGACSRPDVPLSYGDLIKKSNSQAIYYYGSDNKRHLAPNSGVLTSWNFNVPIKEISDSQIDKIPVGSNLTIRPVGYIAKITNKAGYYYVMPLNKIKKFASEAAITRLFGADWQWRVVEIPAAFANDYTVLSGLIGINDKYPNGSLVRFEGNIGIFYIQNSKTRMFNSSTLLPMNNLTNSLAAITTSTSMVNYPVGDEIIGQEPIFVKPF